MRIQDRRGYTLMEVIISVLIVGILAKFAVPQYLKSVEQGKYDDAVALVNQIGMTNRMFALDHGAVYVDGQLTGVSCACVATTCSSYVIPAAPGPFATPCALVCCNYLADQYWNGKPYNFYACDPVSGGGGGPCVAGATAGATRTTAGAGSTSISPYKNWGVWMDSTGQMNIIGAAPNPTY
jgi:prepilin-type N-terminal cleavage/methylation domain-containing protein